MRKRLWGKDTVPRQELGLGVMLGLALAAALAGCRSDHAVVRNPPPSAIAGDTLYVPDGYQDKLRGMGLTEVAAYPYFAPPFIDVAKDAEGKRFAVVFPASGEPRPVPLPLTADEIAERLATLGHDAEGGNRANLSLFEIGGKLVWSFSDGKGTVYLDLTGNPIDPFAADGTK